MGRRRRQHGRPLDGILVLDKPGGVSSNDALQRVKRMFNAAKAGHTGSLDPLATGVLPLCFGEATKFSQFLLDSDKRYSATVTLGVKTATGDADGDVLEECAVPALTAHDVDAALAAFRGTITQVPSMFSAIKQDGQPLYKLARKGIEVERPSREVTVHENRLVAFDGTHVELEIHCSKGTYVRSIAEDLGAALGCGAHVSRLRRTGAGPYREADMVSMEHLAELRDAQEFAALDALLKPVDTAVAGWPEVSLNESMAWYLLQGQPVQVPRAPTSGWVRISQQAGEGAGRFLGVGEVNEDGLIAPRRLVQGKVA